MTKGRNLIAEQPVPPTFFQVLRKRPAAVCRKRTEDDYER